MSRPLVRDCPILTSLHHVTGPRAQDGILIFMCAMTPDRESGAPLTRFLSYLIMKPLSYGLRGLMMTPFSCHHPHVHVLFALVLFIIHGNHDRPLLLRIYSPWDYFPPVQSLVSSRASPVRLSLSDTCITMY